MKPFFVFIFLAVNLRLGYTLLCYDCTTETQDMECDEEHTGNLKPCEGDLADAKGCKIRQIEGGDGEIFLRACSAESDGNVGCSVQELDGVRIRECFCEGEGCNKDWVSAGETPTTPSPGDGTTQSDSLKCYKCSSNDGEDCSPSQPGGQEHCQEPNNKGCMISEVSGPDGTIFERSCSLETDIHNFICVNKTLEDGNTISVCDCQGSLCNRDWDSAGSGQVPEDTIQCYSCDIHGVGPCSDEEHGDEISCPASTGCRIARVEHAESSEMVRGCSTEQEFTCETVDNGEGEGGTTSFCNCGTSLCNVDWVSAGSTQAPDITTTTTLSAETIQCYSCNSLEAGTCSEEEHGEEISCAASTGCRIARNDHGDAAEMVRGCSTEQEFTCETVDNGEGEGETTTFCNCGTSLCNADWMSAGSTTTKTTHNPDITTTATGSADSVHSQTYFIIASLICVMAVVFTE